MLAPMRTPSLAMRAERQVRQMPWLSAFEGAAGTTVGSGRAVITESHHAQTTIA